MSITAGAISQVSVAPTSMVVSVGAASGGTAPYTYQWYISTTSGFTPGAGNIVAGATSQSLQSIASLIPNTSYYVKCVATDAVAATATSTQLLVQTGVPVQSQNSFAQATQLGMVDLRFEPNSVAVQIDLSQATALYAGAAVKMVDSLDGIPKVVGCSANSDEVLGFINYDIKSVSFLAGDRCEISMAGNVMYLYSTGAIARGAQVTLDLSTNGGVASAVTSNKIVGYAFDKASAGGALIRVMLSTPSFKVA